MRVLFIVPYPIDGPSTRYRVEQFVPYLRANGVKVRILRFISSRVFYRSMHQPGRTVPKVLYTLARMVARIGHVVQTQGADVVVIQREAAPYGPALIERSIARLGVPLVYDFDDAIYLRRSSDANRWARQFKQPQKTAEIIGMSRQVIAGNRFLAAYARRSNAAVNIIPTTIDLARYSVRADTLAAPLTIGWVGTAKNAAYLDIVREPLVRLSKTHQIRLLVVGGDVDFTGVPTMCKPWRLENEISDLHAFDIGIMPMPDSEWTRGKCGFKALQYMGVGVPTVASPVGVNGDFIESGANGYLADSPDEWYERLRQLAESAELRRQIGLAGRATVQAQFALERHAPRLLDVLRKAAS